MNPGSVVINEALTHSDEELGDWIELYNATDQAIDIGGWRLSDSDEFLDVYTIPPGTVIRAGDHVVFRQLEHFGRIGDPEAFAIDKLGESIHLASVAPDGSLGGYRESVTFGYAFNSTSFIRHVNTTGEVEWVPSRANTPLEPNTEPLVGIRDEGAGGESFIPALLSEIMYFPEGGGDEYIELHNPYDEPAPLFDVENPVATWAFTAGVRYTLPENVTIPADGYALVVGIDPNEFRRKYNVSGETQISGPTRVILRITENTSFCRDPPYRRHFSRGRWLIRLSTTLRTVGQPRRWVGRFAEPHVVHGIRQ